jgi:hypothetical protein
MTAPSREPGGHRTTAGTLIHFRPTPDGRLVLDVETEDETLRATLSGEGVSPHLLSPAASLSVVARELPAP